MCIYIIYYTRFFAIGKEKQGGKYKKNIFFYKPPLTFIKKCVTMKGINKKESNYVCKKLRRTITRDIDNG